MYLLSIILSDWDEPSLAVPQCWPSLPCPGECEWDHSYISGLFKFAWCMCDVCSDFTKSRAC